MKNSHLFSGGGGRDAEPDQGVKRQLVGPELLLQLLPSLRHNVSRLVRQPLWDHTDHQVGPWPSLRNTFHFVLFRRGQNIYMACMLLVLINLQDYLLFLIISFEHSLI